MMPSCCSASAPIDISVRARVLNAITRITRAEAAALGAVRDPRVQLGYSFPAVVNDEAPPREPAQRYDSGLGPGLGGLHDGTQHVGVVNDWPGGKECPRRPWAAGAHCPCGVTKRSARPRGRAWPHR